MSTPARAGRPALFQAAALMVDGGRSYLDPADGVPLARTVPARMPLVRRLAAVRSMLEIRDLEGRVLLSVGRVPPGSRPHRAVPVFWPDGALAGTIKSRGLVFASFRLRAPDRTVLAVAERAAGLIGERYTVRDSRGAAMATVVEPAQSLAAMGKWGALPENRSLRVDFDAAVSRDLRALIIALPLAMRMRYGWDCWAP